MTTATTPTLPAAIPTASVDDASDHGKFLLYGSTGRGKTYLASTIAELGSTLFVDLTGEHGVESFGGAPWEANITVARPTQVEQLDDLMWWLMEGDHPYTAVVLDSLTGLQRMAVRYHAGWNETSVREIRKGGNPVDMQTWGRSLDVMTDTVTFWFDLASHTRTKPLHVVMTAQERAVESETEGIVLRHVDVQRGARSPVLSNPAYILHLDVESEMNDQGEITPRHIARFGAHEGYVTKARVPYDLRGVIPTILGRGDSPLSLATLARVLRLGGVPVNNQ